MNNGLGILPGLSVSQSMSQHSKRCWWWKGVWWTRLNWSFWFNIKATPRRKLSDTQASSPPSGQQGAAEPRMGAQNRLTRLLAVVLLHALQALQQVVHLVFDLAQLPLDRLQLVHFHWEGKRRSLLLGWYGKTIITFKILVKHLHPHDKS